MILSPKPPIATVLKEKPPASWYKIKRNRLQFSETRTESDVPIQPKNGNLLNRKDIMMSTYNKDRDGEKILTSEMGDAAHSYRSNKNKFAIPTAKNVMLSRSHKDKWQSSTSSATNIGIMGRSVHRYDDAKPHLTRKFKEDRAQQAVNRDLSVKDSVVLSCVENPPSVFKTFDLLHTERAVYKDAFKVTNSLRV